MRSVFIRSHSTITDLEHVRVIPMSRRCEYREVALAKTDPRHRVPAVAYIACSSPKIAADVGSPFPNILAPILAETVNDRATSFLQSLAKFLINRLHLFICIKCSGAAPVVLYVVNSPRCKSASVLFFMPICAFVTGASVRTGR